MGRSARLPEDAELGHPRPRPRAATSILGHMSTTTPDSRLIRQARLAESLTILWMVVELVVALAAGIAARSVALTAFGVDSGLELFTALVVLRQLLLHTERATDEELDARERQASRLAGWGLYGLIVYIVASSGWSLLTQGRPESSTPGLLLAIAVLLVMPVLWRWRRRLADALHSSSLRGDAASRPPAEPLSWLVVGRPGGRAGNDLVDSR